MLGDDAPLTFPLDNELPSPVLHVGTQVVHHAVYAVVQNQGAGLRQDGLPADGTLILPLPPLSDAVEAEAVGAVQCDGLQRKEGRHMKQTAGRSRKTCA